MLIAIETTVYPGATERLILPAAQEGGAESIETSSSRSARNASTLDQGFDWSKFHASLVAWRVSGEVAAAAYGRFVNKVHTLSSARAAEMTKLLENGYRAVNIGYVNEVAVANSLISISGKWFRAQIRSHSVITPSIRGPAQAGTASR
jgi:UDP-N-acetyl-D-glucosamine dehydrogenase